MTPLQTPSDAEAMELLPDELLLRILNYVSDVKSLGRCSALSRRFHVLVPLVSSLLVPVDSIVFSPTNFSPTALLGIPISGDVDAPTALYLAGFTIVSSIIRSAVSFLLKIKPPGFDSYLPLPIPNSPSLSDPSTHHTLLHRVLENFPDLRTLCIYLPSGELSLNDSSSSSPILLCWRAHFSSSLNRCLVLAAAAAESSSPKMCSKSAAAAVAVPDNDTVPDSFFTELGVTLTTSSLFVAFERCRLLQPIISEHTTLESLVLTDADGQGVLHMDRDQIEELRKKPPSLSSKRKMIRAIRMRQWYAPVVELSCGVVLKGATLVAIRPSSGGEEDMGLGWIEEEFDGEEGDGMYSEAVRMLTKDRTRYLETNPLMIRNLL